MAVTLTPHQQDRLDWIVQRLTQGTPLVALRGLAGTGKTTVIPALCEALQRHGITPTVGTPTHRAAQVLKAKGMRDVDTVHSRALTPYFLPPYAAAVDFLAPPGTQDAQGRETQGCPTWAPYDPAQEQGPYGYPAILEQAAARYRQAVSAAQMTLAMEELKDIARSRGAQKALATLGIQGHTYFDGFGPKTGLGCLIIDEASMIGAKLLALCRQAFPLVCLIGDPGQLPPVKDEAVLEQVEGVALTEIHRQAADSPIISLAYAARERTVQWASVPLSEGQLEEYYSVAAATFLTSPLLVWRNKVRLAHTAAIRAALGYPPDQPVAGEPLVCRSQDPSDRVDGYYNNAMFRVLEVTNPQTPLARLEGLSLDGGQTPNPVRLHIEELHGETVHPDAVPMRFGYCLTAHTAQGSEWPAVYIDKRELMAYWGAAMRSRDPAERHSAQRWAYTAITRAKDSLGFLLHGDFSKTERSVTMPQMTALADEHPSLLPAPQPEALGAGLERAPEPEDIPDPPVPADALTQAPLAGEGLQPTTAAWLAALKPELMAIFWQYMREAESSFTRIAETIQANTQTQIEALQHTITATEVAALERLAEAIQAGLQAHTQTRLTPYRATLSVVAPSGYPMQFACEGSSQDQLLEQLSGVLGFCKANGFTVPALEPAQAYS